MGLGGDGDLGAGPPYPVAPGADNFGSAVMLGSGFAGAGTIGGVALGEPQSRCGDLRSHEALLQRVRNLEVNGDEHEQLRERIRTLEESLHRLGRESLERAKVGMERVAEKHYLPGQQQPRAVPRQDAGRRGGAARDSVASRLSNSPEAQQPHGSVVPSGVMHGRGARAGWPGASCQAA